MGHPKFARRSYDVPAHPWRAERIEEEHAIRENYGLRKRGGMREIWRAKTQLRRLRQQSMKLTGRVDSSTGHLLGEKEAMLNSLFKKGLIGDAATLDDVLQITLDHILARRLQSQVYYHGLASSMRQARQLVVHGHISIGEQKMTVPGYIITREEEAQLAYVNGSPLIDEVHPLRQEIAAIRDEAEYEGEGESAPTRTVVEADEVAELAAAAAASPAAEDTIPKEDDAS
jgi:small subunit ribosomal protein S4